MQPAWLHILPGRQFEGSPEVANCNWVTDLFWPSIFWPVDTKGRRNSIWNTFYQVPPSSGWCVTSMVYLFGPEMIKGRRRKTEYSNLKIRVNSPTRVLATFSTSLMLTASLCPLLVGSLLPGPLRSGSTRSLLSLLPVLSSEVIGCSTAVLNIGQKEVAPVRSSSTRSGALFASLTFGCESWLLNITRKQERCSSTIFNADWLHWFKEFLKAGQQAQNYIIGQKNIERFWPLRRSHFYKKNRVIYSYSLLLIAILFYG